MLPSLVAIQISSQSKGEVASRSHTIQKSRRIQSEVASIQSQVAFKSKTWSHANFQVRAWELHLTSLPVWSHYHAADVPIPCPDSTALACANRKLNDLDIAKMQNISRDASFASSLVCSVNELNNHNQAKWEITLTQKYNDGIQISSQTKSRR